MSSNINNNEPNHEVMKEAIKTKNIYKASLDIEIELLKITYSFLEFKKQDSQFPEDSLESEVHPKALIYITH